METKVVHWRRALCVIALLLASLALCGDTIRMAWFEVQPHLYAGADGKPTGPTVALFESIAKRMGHRVAWVGPIPLTRLGAIQKSGELKLDGAPLHIKTASTMEYLLYPQKPYFVALPSLTVRADNPLRLIRSIDDIKGYRIGFVQTPSMSYPPIISENRDKLVLDDLTGEDWTSRNVAKLLSGRLDAVYERNQYTGFFQAILDGVDAKVRQLALPADPIPHYFVFDKESPKALGFLRDYERAVAKMKIDYDAMVRLEMDKVMRSRVKEAGPRVNPLR
jgi:ABC-type amino acid transport substrate-binding protein